MRGLKLRSAEWVALAFFAYVVVLIPMFQDRPNLHGRPISILLVVAALVCAMAKLEQTRYAHIISLIRDWLPLTLALTAFREMELFIPQTYDHGNEIAWERWDVILLRQWGLTGIIERLGPLLPGYLELCYLLVYGVGAYAIVTLWIDKEHEKVDRVMTVYLLGTLGAYAFFPFFPSRPPRLIFPGVDGPHVSTWFKTFNWYILSKATIHSAVFPSAHVSSAFAAAWAMFIVDPARRLRAWSFLVYAVSVSIATVYGRYHYAADVLAGFAVSCLAALIGIALNRSWSTPSRARSNIVA